MSVPLHGFLPEWRRYYETVLRGEVPDEHLSGHMASFVAGWLANLRTIQTIMSTDNSHEMLSGLFDEASAFADLLCSENMRKGLEALHLAAMMAPRAVEERDDGPGTSPIVH